MTFTWCKCKNQFFKQAKKNLSDLVIKLLILFISNKILQLISANTCFQKNIAFELHF